MKTNSELKKIAQAALRSEYGVKPSLDKITLLESNDDGTYIAFAVTGRYYKFDSYQLADGSIWVGAGTIEKMPQYNIKDLM